MSPPNEGVTFDKFYRYIYDNAINEPHVSRFHELSRAGCRRGMIELILDIPSVKTMKVTESYRGKSDARAKELYETSLKTVMDKGYECEGEFKACTILTEALFAASVNSRVFLDALLERSKRWYNSGCFVKCLRNCKCMLALPASFYDTSPDSAKHFLECRKECLRLERECSRKLETISYRKKKRGKNVKVYESPKITSTEKRLITTPALDGRPHSILESCSDALALQFNENRGRHLVATRDIKPGSVLIVDRPFSFSTDAEALKRNCLHCHTTLKLEDSIRIPCYNCQTVSFCSETCRSDAWQMYHRYECSVLDVFFERDYKQLQRQSSHLLLAYRTILKALHTDAMKHVGDKAHNTTFNTDIFQDHIVRFSNNIDGNAYIKSDIETQSIEFGQTQRYNPCDYKTVLQLKTHCSNAEPNTNLIRSIEAIFLTKCLIFSVGNVKDESSLLVPLAMTMLHHLQAVNCNAYEIVENVRDETTRIWDPRNVGGALYTTVSLTNHSCYPNVVRHSYPNGLVVVRALRFIDKGNEILDSYGPHFLIEDQLERRNFLWKKYHFLCSCIACLQNWKSPVPDLISYKCNICTETIYTSVTTNDTTEKKKIVQCVQCQGKLDCKKIEKQLRKSVEKRLGALARMYQGQYDEALLPLLEHANFIEKCLTTPNMEAIKTQQCINQCYNAFGCTSIK